MKYVLRQEADRWRVYKLKKGSRQVVSIAGRSYGTDDFLFYRDPKTSDAWMTVDIDDSQPYRHEPIYYETRRLSIANISAKAANNRKQRLLRLDGSKIYTYLGAAIVAGALLYYVVLGGGFF